jgi:hypothetical protein
MKTARWIFRVAAIYGLIVLLPLTFLSSTSGAKRLQG